MYFKELPGKISIKSSISAPEDCFTPGGCGGGDSDIFTYVVSGHFLGFKFLNFNVLRGFQKIEYFWGMKILWIFLGGSSQSWTIFRGHFYAL